ncbi:MAG TPA: class I SAM-dependent methyltransferase [Polyangiaceae bacterium]|jgi:SAM-dependent methyltransferase
MSGQTWDPTRYETNARYVSDLGAPVVELLAPRAGERILDLGCGDGALTRKIADLGCEVVGLDASLELLEAARARGLDVRAGSGEALAFSHDFDAVFSNAALHWMKAADDVIAGVARALRPGGRFVGEFGGHGCVDKIRSELVAGLNRRGVDGQSRVPWYFPSAEEYGTKLERAGFRVASITLFPRPTPLPGDVIGWLETFGGTFTTALAPGERAAYLEEVREALAPRLRDASGTWVADYVRLRFCAVLRAPRA